MKKLGTVYPYKARLYKGKKEIGYCIDTPNAIAKAIMETGATMVKEYLGHIVLASKYADRMQSWNTCISGVILK